MGKTIYTTITTVLSCCLLIVVIAMCVPSVHASFVDSTIGSSNKYAELKQKYEALNLNIEVIALIFCVRLILQLLKCLENTEKSF